jgi:hypothetical protein
LIGQFLFLFQGIEAEGASACLEFKHTVDLASDATSEARFILLPEEIG